MPDHPDFYPNYPDHDRNKLFSVFVCDECGEIPLRDVSVDHDSGLMTCFCCRAEVKEERV